MSEDIRIYVACLAAYNSGYLHGRWIDATLELDDIQQQINAMLAESPVEDAEEYAIHDYEGFGGYKLGEYEGVERVYELACFIEEYPALAGELLNHFSGSLEDARKAAEDQYSGCYTSLADYAQEWTENTSEVPSHLELYIDYERMGRDFEMGGDIFTLHMAHDEVHVFWSH
jgi:antirestriction protein